MPQSSTNPKKTGGKSASSKSARSRTPVKKKKNRIRGMVIALSAFLFFACLVLLVMIWFRSTLGLISNKESEGVGQESLATQPLTNIDISESSKNEYLGQLEQNQIPVISDEKKVTNILLMAVDSRSLSESGLSDSMILLSINREDKKLVLCSFMRDILVKMPSEPSNPMAGQLDKLTHAHAYGGPMLTLAALRENFNIKVDYYAKINFFSFVDIIDAVGGLDIELSAAEADWINSFLYWDETVEIFPSYPKTQLTVRSGVHHLNGLQALAHARNRDIGSDWQRTQRQRDIIGCVLQKLKGMPLTKINGFLTKALPHIVTNMDDNMLEELALNVLSFAGYERVSTRFPLDGTFREENYNIIPDVEVNCEDLYEKIYGKAP